MFPFQKFVLFINLWSQYNTVGKDVNNYFGNCCIPATHSTFENPQDFRAGFAWQTFYDHQFNDGFVGQAHGQCIGD